MRENVQHLVDAQWRAMWSAITRPGGRHGRKARHGSAFIPRPRPSECAR